jgi:hypothetical protein
MLRMSGDLYRNFAFGFGAGALIVLVHFLGAMGGAGA